MNEGNAAARASQRLAAAAEVSRADRDSSLDALHTLEGALSSPTPGREGRWLSAVIDALDALGDAVETQASGDAAPDSLLSEIATDQPRLAQRIERLRDEHRDLRDAVRSLRGQIHPHADLPIDAGDIRERLASAARRFRQHRAREADLIYEAINLSLGAGD